MKLFRPTLFLRTDKIDASGRMPLYIRFPRVAGKDARFSFGGIRLAVDEWDEASQRPKDEFLRLDIDKAIIRVKEGIIKLRACGATFNKDVLRTIVKKAITKNNPSDKTDLFLDYFDEYLDKKNRIRHIETSTFRNYLTTRNALEEFNPKLRISDISQYTMYRFMNYMRAKGRALGKGEVPSSIRNRLIHLRAVIRYIERLGIEVDNPFSKMEVYIEPANRNHVYLNPKELRKFIVLRKKSLTDTELNVLQMFLFSCATAMRVSDVQALIWNSVGQTKDVITYQSRKMKKTVYVPLTPMAELLLCEVGERDIDNIAAENKIFHKVSTTTINKVLKSLCHRVGIEKNITFHSARRTFSTLCANNAVSDYIKERSMGHAPTTMNKSYEQWDEETAHSNKGALAFLDLKKLCKVV